jgi:hypothetical protein
LAGTDAQPEAQRLRDGDLPLFRKRSFHTIMVWIPT